LTSMEVFVHRGTQVNDWTEMEIMHYYIFYCFKLLKMLSDFPYKYARIMLQ
jgi:hypothetical protein